MKLAAVALVTLAAAQCPERKEFRDLSPEEKQIYFDAIKQLQQKPKPYRGGKTAFEYFTKIHMDYQNSVHGTPMFLPWHRQFIHLYEEELRKINPRVVLPYWDWSLDSNAPHQSPVLQMVGGNGNSSQGYCVTQGPFEKWQVNHPQQHCLRREYDMGGSISPFASTESLSFDCNEPSFSDFSLRLEIKHGNPHVGIGGNSGDLTRMHSPNDPIFYLHHTFVDMIWEEWKQRNPDSPFEGSRFDQQVNENSVLPFFNITVRDTLDISRYCYSYSRFPRTSEIPEPVSADQPASDTVNRRQAFLARWGKRRLGFLLKNRQRFNFIREKLGSGLLRPIFQSINATIAFKLKKRKPLPDSFLRMNNLNPAVVRQYESEDAELVDLINSIF
ncbi:hypothetical protein DSO57_1022878 [Entomophthora muscae]|uniref:Uncharacterized protein n=1 Tax=Entomophthora muscae TaxID=34485 RepID=A0ACC2SFX5_9FUNG|nr:hypothetical protein DSO57_1022878 [Entomophthora muscae]